MRFREAVFAETENLLVDLLREGGVVTVLAHAVEQALFEGLEAALALPRRHRSTQLVGLAGREPGGDDGKLHHLLLEDRHAFGTLQNTAHSLAGIGHRFEPLPPPQIRMHHAALDRSGPHDRNLDHQVVEICRRKARQHRHLRPRFDLEHAHGVGLLNHRIDSGVFRGHIAHRQRHSPLLADQG